MKLPRPKVLRMKLGMPYYTRIHIRPEKIDKQHWNGFGGSFFVDTQTSKGKVEIDL